MAASQLQERMPALRRSGCYVCDPARAAPPASGPGAGREFRWRRAGRAPTPPRHALGVGAGGRGSRWGLR